MFFYGVHLEGNVAFRCIPFTSVSAGVSVAFFLGGSFAAQQSVNDSNQILRLTVVKNTAVVMFHSVVGRHRRKTERGAGAPGKGRRLENPQGQEGMSLRKWKMVAVQKMLCNRHTLMMSCRKCLGHTPLCDRLLLGSCLHRICSGRQWHSTFVGREYQPLGK